MFYQEALPKCYCAYFCMGAYKRDVVVVIKIGACIYGCLFCEGAYYPGFTAEQETVLVQTTE